MGCGPAGRSARPMKCRSNPRLGPCRGNPVTFGTPKAKALDCRGRLRLPRKDQSCGCGCAWAKRGGTHQQWVRAVRGLWCGPAGRSARPMKRRSNPRLGPCRAVLAGRGEWLFHSNELQRSHVAARKLCLRAFEPARRKRPVLTPQNRAICPVAHSPNG